MVARPAVLCGSPKAVAPAFTIARYRFDGPQADPELQLNARCLWQKRKSQSGAPTGGPGANLGHYGSRSRYFLRAGIA